MPAARAQRSAEHDKMKNLMTVSILGTGYRYKGGTTYTCTCNRTRSTAVASVHASAETAPERRERHADVRPDARWDRSEGAGFCPRYTLGEAAGRIFCCRLFGSETWIGQ